MNKLFCFISIIFLLLSSTILPQSRVMPSDYGGNYTQPQMNYFISTMPDTLEGKADTLTTRSTHIWSSGGSVVLATSGTDKACSNGARYWVEIMIPYDVTLTGVAYLVGSVGGTDSVVVQLFNSSGTQVATSRLPGTAADLVGTAAQLQSVPFSSTYNAKAGVYYIAVQFNGTTAKFRTFPIPGSKFIAGTVAGTWGTAANITPGTTFTADTGPICITY